MSERNGQSWVWADSDWYRVGAATVTLKQLLNDTVRPRTSTAPGDPLAQALNAQLVEILETLDLASRAQTPRPPRPE